jgi:hypothetical protein
MDYNNMCMSSALRWRTDVRRYSVRTTRQPFLILEIPSPDPNRIMTRDNKEKKQAKGSE